MVWAATPTQPHTIYLFHWRPAQAVWEGRTSTAQLVGDTFRCWCYSLDSLCRTPTSFMSLCSTALAVLRERLLLQAWAGSQALTEEKLIFWAGKQPEIPALKSESPVSVQNTLIYRYRDVKTVAYWLKTGSAIQPFPLATLWSTVFMEHPPWINQKRETFNRLPLGFLHCFVLEKTCFGRRPFAGALFALLKSVYLFHFLLFTEVVADQYSLFCKAKEMCWLRVRVIWGSSTGRVPHRVQRPQLSRLVLWSKRTGLDLPQSAC